MTAKRKPLPALDATAFEHAARPIADPVQVATAPKPGLASGGTRQGKVQIQAWVTKDTRRRLKIHAAKVDKTVDQLLTEAVEQIVAGSG